MNRYQVREGHLIVDTNPDHYPGVPDRPPHLRERPVDPVAAVWHPDNALAVAAMLNDVDAARENAAADIWAAADRQCDDLRNELRRHQLAMTKATEKRLGQHTPALAEPSFPVGVLVALDAVARDYIRRAVEAAIDRDSVGHEDYPEIGEYDFIRIRDRAVALTATDPDRPYTVDDAIEHLAARTTEPDQVAGEPPAELPPFPTPIGGGS